MEIIKGLKTRVFGNTRSSIVGLVLLGIGCAALLIGKASLTELGGFVGVVASLFFFYAQDSILKVNPNDSKNSRRTKGTHKRGTATN